MLYCRLGKAWFEMGIFRQSVEKKREKLIQKEAKAFVKKLTLAGMDRKTAKNRMEMLSSLVTEGYYQNKVYAKSKVQIGFAMMLIEKLMEEMHKKDVQTIRERLKKLSSVLGEVFHECTIREDDMDFSVTCTYIKSMAEIYDDVQCVIVQSELENLLHLFTEVKEWEEPDFCALAFFLKYGKKSELGELANCLRNERIIHYYREQYWDNFEGELSAVGMKEEIELWIKEKVNRFSDYK